MADISYQLMSTSLLRYHLTAIMHSGVSTTQPGTGHQQHQPTLRTSTSSHSAATRLPRLPGGELLRATGLGAPHPAARGDTYSVSVGQTTTRL
jgi:hypothetical protein